jgi:hypothetical protein
MFDFLSIEVNYYESFCEPIIAALNDGYELKSSGMYRDSDGCEKRWAHMVKKMPIKLPAETMTKEQKIELFKYQDEFIGFKDEGIYVPGTVLMLTRAEFFKRLGLTEEDVK